MGSMTATPPQAPFEGSLPPATLMLKDVESASQGTQGDPSSLGQEWGGAHG